MKFHLQKAFYCLIFLLLLSSCNQTNNVWKIQGNIKNYSNKPVYVSVRGQIDSVKTDNEGNFFFERVNQYSEFVKLSTNNKMKPYLHLFADSVCKIVLNIDDPAKPQNAEIKNSPLSIELQNIFSWHAAQKHVYDSLVQDYKNLRNLTARDDTLRLIYIEKVDSLNDIHYNYLSSYISRNPYSPIATTASFLTFDTINYTPILLRDAEGVKYFTLVNKEMKKRFGLIPFVQLYDKSVRSIELQNRP